jgi:hypothetical protein
MEGVLFFFFFKSLFTGMAKVLATILGHEVTLESRSHIWNSKKLESSPHNCHMKSNPIPSTLLEKNKFVSCLNNFILELSVIPHWTLFQLL